MKVDKLHGQNYNISRGGFLVGIDEVGRGPLAGPVSVGAFAVPVDSYKDLVPHNLKNSKALLPKERESWFSYFHNLAEEKKVFYNVASVSHETVDQQGIVFSIKLALARALDGLALDPSLVKIFLDGGLRAPRKYKNQETIIRGDEKIPVIAAASIMAKVTRDRFMVDISRIFPQYGFDEHKGYATALHYNNLLSYGPSPLHRLTYLEKMRERAIYPEVI